MTPTQNDLDRGILRNLCIYDADAAPGVVSERLMSLIGDFFASLDDDEIDHLFVEGDNLPDGMSDYYQSVYSLPQGKIRLILAVGKRRNILLGAC